MDYKEKLKEALNSDNTDYEVVRWIEQNFPELRESEDERIRKELIEFVKSRGGFKQEYIAWIEEQANHANFRNKIQIGDKVTKNEDGVLVNLSKLSRVAKKDENQGKQSKNEDKGILHRFSFYSYKDEPNILYLAGLYVDDEYRNKGIGTKILKVANEVAASMKCNSIRLKTEKGSHAEKLYRENGYTTILEEENQIWLEKQGEQKPAWSEVDEKFFKTALWHISYSISNGKSTDFHCDTTEWLKSLRPQNRWKPSDEQIFELECVVKQNKDNMLGKNLQLLLEQLKNLK